MKIIVVVGPTATGKSTLAVNLARQFRGEIISADSRQVYRGLDIGTGKITGKEKNGIPHHLLDVASPRQKFNAARFVRLARQAIKQVALRGHLPIICGGTGFYIDALLGRITLSAVTPNLKLRMKIEKLSNEALKAMLNKLDPERAQNIDLHNRRRIIRAIEIALTKEEKHLASTPPDYQTLILGIKIDKTKLRQQIARRLRRRWKQGLIKEVDNLARSALSWHRLHELGLEYRLTADYLQNKLTQQEYRIKLEQAIWQYAKRQLTWFKRDKTIEWITNYRQARKLVQTFLK